MAEPDRRGIADRAVIDTGLGPMTVAAVVVDRPRALRDRLARWVPPAVRAEIVRLEAAGELNRSRLAARPDGRYLRRFELGPRDVVVVWIGEEGFNVDVQAYRELPTDLAFYREVASDDIAVASLLQVTYTNFNRDLWHLVHDVGLSPEQAKQEIRRVDAELTDLLIAALTTLQLSFGLGASAIQSYGRRTARAAQQAEVARAARAAQRAGRRALPLAVRRQAALIVLYRGTTLSRVRGEIRVGVDDLGPGTYFGDTPTHAGQFTQGSRVASEPGVILRAEVTEATLGRILDLTRPPHREAWNALVAQVGGRVRNEQYLRLLEAYLGEIGTTLDEFDTIIGPNYLQGAKTQINIRNPAVLDRVLEVAEEVTDVVEGGG